MVSATLNISAVLPELTFKQKTGREIKTLHHLTSAAGGRSAVEATAQSVQWWMSVTESVHGFTTPVNQSQHRYVYLLQRHRCLWLSQTGSFLYWWFSSVLDVTVIEAVAEQSYCWSVLTSWSTKYIHIKKFWLLKYSAMNRKWKSSFAKRVLWMGFEPSVILR